MRKYLLAAVAATAIATPAVARDHTFYAGIEGGVMLVEDGKFNLNNGVVSVNDQFTINHKVGYDVDVIGGYDFGMFRTEAELGYKHAGIDDLLASSSPITGGGQFNTSGSARVWTAMANVLLDFGDDNGWSGYVGGGAGYANVRYNIDTVGFGGRNISDKDGSFAWQAIAGVRHPISDNIDLGLKYRFFNANKLSFSETGFGAFDGKFRSHSLLASLIFNFAPPPPPPPVVIAPPPPPPPPATQTCPDGSVILATEVCPAAPVYVPPPPPPAPERG